jgi:hypothetical protein
MKPHIEPQYGDCAICASYRQESLLNEVRATAYQSGRIDAGDSSYGNGFVEYYVAACAGGLYVPLRESWRSWCRVHEAGER